MKNVLDPQASVLDKRGKTTPGRKALPKLISTPQPLSIRVQFIFAGDIISEQKEATCSAGITL
jgi:hypothetical protein